MARNATRRRSRSSHNGDGTKFLTPGACFVTAGTGSVGTAYGTVRVAANNTVGQLTAGGSGAGTFLLTCDLTEISRTLPNKGSTVTGVALFRDLRAAPTAPVGPRIPMVLPCRAPAKAR